MKKRTGKLYYFTGTCFGYGLNVSLERGNVRERSGRLILRGD